MMRLVTQFDDRRTRATVATPTCCCCCCCCVASIVSTTVVTVLNVNDVARETQAPEPRRWLCVVAAVAALPVALFAAGAANALTQDEGGLGTGAGLIAFFVAWTAALVLVYRQAGLASPSRPVGVTVLVGTLLFFVELFVAGSLPLGVRRQVRPVSRRRRRGGAVRARAAASPPVDVATMTYVADPAWALVHDPGLLVLHAGADELFAIEDVSDAVAAELLALWREPLMDPDVLSQEAGDVFEQLKSAGIVRNAIAPRRAYTLGLRFAGAPDGAFTAALAAALPGRIAPHRRQRRSRSVLVVRTSGTLAELTGDGYAELATPHLLLDLAFGHTICLGPLVFAGQTACLACLGGRIAHLWGDLAPPPRPRMTDHPGLAAGLAALAVGEILLRDGRSLVNRTVSHDFAAHAVRSASVYRLPMCPACSPLAPERRGSIELPWAAAVAP